MIFITAKFQVLPEHAEAWPEISREFTEACRAEDGCLWFDWSRSLDDPNEYVLVEAFRDGDAGAAHVGSDHFKAAAGELPAVPRRHPEDRQPERRPGRLERARRDEGRALGHGRPGAADRPGSRRPLGRRARAGADQRPRARRRHPGVERAQRRLAALGCSPGPADGRLGPRTRSAVLRFQSRTGLAQSGRLDAGHPRADCTPPTRRAATVVRCPPARAPVGGS